MARKADVRHRILSSGPYATVLFGLIDGRIEDANEIALALYGYSSEEMIGLPFSALSAEPKAKLHKRKDGSMFTIEAHHSTVSVGGREVGVSVIRELPAAPAGIMLDLNAILISILSLTELAIKAMSEADPARTDLEEVRRLSLRGVKLTEPGKVLKPGTGAY